MPKISVIMPIYKTESEHLKLAINSILAQSFQDFEFIILNDSPEDTKLKEIVFSYKDSRIKYFEKKDNHGVAQSYNRLLDLAAGEFVAIMNHDDMAHPRRLEKQVIFLNRHKDIGLVGTGYKKFGEINRFKAIRNPTNDAEIKALLLFKSSIHHPTIMFRREIAAKNNIRYNENFISLNDRQFCYDMGRYTGLANMPDVLYYYRFHQNMISKQKKPKIFQEQCEFHSQWFKHAGIELDREDKYIFDNFISKGKCHIKDKHTLENIERILTMINEANRQHPITPDKEFADVCGLYLVKRCLNAAFYGGINSSNILKETHLPVKSNILLTLCNMALWWRR